MIHPTCFICGKAINHRINDEHQIYCKECGHRRSEAFTILGNLKRQAFNPKYWADDMGFIELKYRYVEVCKK